MQRRLALALALTALAAVVLVGLGVVLQANRGARSDATASVIEEVQAIADLASGTRPLGEFGRQLAQSQQAFDFESLGVVWIDDDGEVLGVRTRGVRGRFDPRTLNSEGVLGDLPPALDADQLAALGDGDPVVFDGDRVVVVMVALDIETPDLAGGDGTFGLVAAERVLALPRRAMGWFLWSSVIVLAGASAAGVVLARRLVGPIRDIQRTTTALASGDLRARTDVVGDDELAELGRSVNIMAAELERSKQLDQQFLMSISHDLRTPLTAIGGYAEALVDGTATDGRATGSVIGQQARRLERLVQDLLDLAHLDANRFQLNSSRVDLAVVTGRTVAGLAATAAERGVELRFERPDGQALAVHADPDRVAQIVANLVDNATKFARRTVEVQVRADDRDGVVSVVDDGPGVDEADLPHIFDRLYSGRNADTRGRPGAGDSTGLGLTIVRELTTAMGGAVTVSGDPGRGTRFEVRLPLLTGSDGVD